MTPTYLGAGIFLQQYWITPVSCQIFSGNMPSAGEKSWVGAVIILEL